MKINQKPIKQVFWENFDRYRLEAGSPTFKVMEDDLGLGFNYLSNSRRRSCLPQARVIEKIAEYFEMPYIEFFTDWDE